MREPRQYQLQAIDVIKRQNLLLADDTGLGKTITAIEAVKVVQAEYKLPALIIVPKPLILQWAREIALQDVEPSRIITLDSKSTNDDFNRIDIDSIVLMHYEALVKLIKVYHMLGKWSIVVVDEGHKIKNRKAIRTEAIKQLNAKRKVVMTATPYDKDPAEAWSLLNWLDPQFFRSYWAFFEAHVNYQEIRVYGNKTVKQVIKHRPVRDPAKLARVLRPYMMRRLKKEVRADLPERIDQYVDLDMASDQAAFYDALAEAEIALIDEANDTEISMPILLTRILRLIQATTDPKLLKKDASSVKLDWLDDWLEANPNESVIIFTRFRETALQLQERYNFDKCIVGGIERGEITANDRRIVSTIASGGTGLDLPHIDHAIFIDVEWSSILMQQAIDRIYRINIENVKHIYYLRCVGTVDELVHSALTQKWSTKRLVETFLLKGQKHATSDRV